MGAEEVRDFQLHMIREKKLALGTVALRMGALRFLYKKTLRRRDIDIDDLPLIKTPRRSCQSFSARRKWLGLSKLRRTCDIARC